MSRHRTVSTLARWTVLLGAIVLTGVAGCGLTDSAAPVATPAVGLSRARVPLGGPLELTYQFTVAPDAPPFIDDYRVFVHFLDADGELMFTDDHPPPQSTTSWQPGQAIRYDRRMIIPVFPYIGEVSVAVGLYSATAGDRLPLAGEHIGTRAYEVARFEMAPQSESGFLIYGDGWHMPESAQEEPDREWRWTTGQAAISFTNPQTAATLYLEIDGRPEIFERPQVLTVSIDDTPIETIELASEEPTYHVVSVPAASLGTASTVTLTLTVDPPFVPSDVTNGANADDRELGMQVFYAFLEEQN